MEGQEQALFTIAEAAQAWGISRQAVYKRLTTIDNQACIVVMGKQRYITRDCIEAYRGEVNQVDNQPTTKRQPNDNQLTTEVDRLKAALLEEQGRTSTLQAEIDAQRAALMEAQGRASTLQGTVNAQRAHIDSLQAALDKTQTALNQEQQLHLATMQQRLPAGRGEGLFSWFRRKTKGTAE